MLLTRLRALAQTIGFGIMGLLMLAGATSIFRSANYALGAPVHIETRAAKAIVLQQQAANVPQLMNYAGELRNKQGQLMNGAYTMTFRIYANKDADPSQALWSEVRSDIRVQNGRFALVLGEGSPLSPKVFESPERYFGVSVDSADGRSPISEDTPALRKRFASVPYAMTASNAMTAGYATTAGSVPGLVSHQTFAEPTQQNFRIMASITNGNAFCRENHFQRMIANTIGCRDDSYGLAAYYTNGTLYATYEYHQSSTGANGLAQAAAGGGVWAIYPMSDEQCESLFYTITCE